MKKAGMQIILGIAVAVLLYLPNILPGGLHTSLSYDGKEQYNPALAFLNTTERLQKHIDSIAISRHISTPSFAYAELVETVTKQRFYHGFSHFSFRENWIAALCGKWFEEGLACKVIPNDIMQHANAACSQQSLVMMEIFRNKQIAYRKVGFPHHYAMEIFDNGHWYFIDADMEPAITREQRRQSSWQLQNDQLKKYYDTTRFTDLDYKFGTAQTATTGIINEIPAQHARLFHTATALLSKTLWLLPVLYLLYTCLLYFLKSLYLKKSLNPFKQYSLAT